MKKKKTYVTAKRYKSHQYLVEWLLAYSTDMENECDVYDYNKESWFDYFLLSKFTELQCKRIRKLAMQYDDELGTAKYVERAMNTL